MLEQKPHHIRRKIALICTLVIAVILIVVMVLHYIHASAPASTETGSRIKDFYNTVSNNSQSFFERN